MGSTWACTIWIIRVPAAGLYPGASGSGVYLIHVDFDAFWDVAAFTIAVSVGRSAATAAPTIFDNASAVRAAASSSSSRVGAPSPDSTCFGSARGRCTAGTTSRGRAYTLRVAFEPPPHHGVVAHGAVLRHLHRQRRHGPGAAAPPRRRGPPAPRRLLRGGAPGVRIAQAAGVLCRVDLGEGAPVAEIGGAAGHEDGAARRQSPAGEGAPLLVRRGARGGGGGGVRGVRARRGGGGAADGCGEDQAAGGGGGAGEAQETRTRINGFLNGRAMSEFRRRR